MIPIPSLDLGKASGGAGRVSEGANRSRTVEGSKVLLMLRRLVLLSVGVVIVVAACGGEVEPTESSVVIEGPASGGSVAERLAEIDSFVTLWRTAGTLDEAGAAAEGAANLVVGPDGPGYGDRNGDGVVGGASTVGLIPGMALPLEDNECVLRDVLGGAWDEPLERWDEMLDAIDAWRPGNNTMPTLASHPMRVVGWATFTLASDSLDEAHEYAGHAKLHVDVSVRALEC